MPRFAANLSFLYPELEFTQRFAAAARDGFRAVEYLFPYAHDAHVLAALLQRHGLQQVLFNAPAGNWAAGERGTACLAGREAECLAGVEQAIAYAKVLQCPRIHLMAGVVGDRAQDARAHAVYVGNVRGAAQRAAAHGIDILLEPINRHDMPGFFLNHVAQALAVIEEVALPNVKLQLDVYHCQISDGHLADKLRRHIPHRQHGRIGHIQVAAVPGRGAPDHGEINYPWLFELIDRLGFDGWIGCEYHPGSAAGATSAGLGWMKPWL